MKRHLPARLPFAFLALAMASTAAAQSPPPRDMPAGFQEALQACADEQGLPPPPAPGQKPDATKPDKAKRPDRRKFDTCMSAKGFEPPHRGHGPGAPPPEEEDEE